MDLKVRSLSQHVYTHYQYCRRPFAVDFGERVKSQAFVEALKECPTVFKVRQVRSPMIAACSIPTEQSPEWNAEKVCICGSSSGGRVGDWQEQTEQRLKLHVDLMIE